MSIHSKILIVLVLLLAVVLGAVAGGYYWTVITYIKVDGIRYERNAAQLDLRGQKVSPEHHENLQKALPDCKILWDVPFQQGTCSSDTQKITVTAIAQEDIQQLRYLPDLQEVDATKCIDLPMVQKLQEAYPDLKVTYGVEIGGEILDMGTESLNLDAGEGDFTQLMDRLAYLPQMKSIYFEEPELTADELMQLQEAYPGIQMTWTKTVFGKPMSCDTEELDISGMQFASVEEIEKQANYLTGLKKLTMCDTGFANEDIAAFRERARGRYKVVWNLKIGQIMVRTDDTWFMPTKLHLDVKDRDVQNLKYCEDMICIDLGHNVIKNIDWLRGTPHVKYLIIADGPLREIDAIGTLKELKFLELFMTDIRDITPLLGCTALEDLNVARIPASLRPLSEMKWLKNLWMSGGWVSREDEAFLRQELPNTRIDAAHHHNCCGRGWRQIQNYYDMRDILGMPYYLE